MENISHVNKYFYLRLLTLPFTFLEFLFRYLSIIKLSKRYFSGLIDASEERRYEQLLKFFERGLFMKKNQYSFFLKTKVLQNKVVFVVNESFDWNSLALLKRLVICKKNNLPTFLLSKKLSNLFDLIDVFYGEKELQEALLSKKSLIIEKSFFENEKVASIIKSSRFSIIPIYRNQIMSWVRYVIGSPIKFSSSISDVAFKNYVCKSIDDLKENLSSFNKPRKKFSFRKLFNIY